MRCARIISAATAPGTSTRRRSTSSQGRHSLRTRDQCRAVDGPVDDLDRHGSTPTTTATSTGTPRSIPRSRRGSARSRARLRRGELRLRHELSLQGPTRGERPRHLGRRSTVRSSGCVRSVTNRSFSTCTTGRLTCRTTSSTPTARTGSRPSRRSSRASSPTRPPRSRPCARVTEPRWSASPRCSSRRSSRSSRPSTCARTPSSRSSPTTASRGASASPRRTR